MGLYVSTVSSSVAISELGITLTHPTTDYQVDAQFNGDEIRNAVSLTQAITSGAVIWKKTPGGVTETAVSYDADFIQIEQLNTGTQITVDPTQINNLSSTVRSVILTGLNLLDNTAITAADTILVALGKIQSIFNAHTQPGAGHGVANSTTPGFMSSDDKIKIDSFFPIKMPANLTNSSNVTAVSIPALAQNCVAGKSYSFTMKIQFSTTATTTGIGVSLNGTAIGNLASMMYTPISATGGTANAFSGPIGSFLSYITATAVGTAGVRYLLEVRGVFVCTSSGTFFPVFRSEVNGSTVTVYAGSTMECTEI